jgi:hypothetical protein
MSFWAAKQIILSPIQIQELAEVPLWSFLGDTTQSAGLSRE